MALALAPLWQPMTQRRLFRVILDAAARPGTIAELRPLLQGAPAISGVLATFCDASQTLADPDRLLSAADWSFLGARPEEPSRARFVLADGAMPLGAWTPALGTLEAPDLGATLILRVARLGEGAAWRLSGPGIPGERLLRVSAWDEGWIEARARWCGQFPLGCDLLLADAQRVVALPRTTRIERG